MNRLLILCCWVLVGVNALNAGAQDENTNPNWDWRAGDYPEYPYPGSLYKMYIENGLGQVVAVPRNSPWSQGNAWVGLQDNEGQDGWVLVARDFGTPTRPIFAADQKGSPYFILYNKYKSLLRFFILVRANQPFTAGSIGLRLGGAVLKTATLTHMTPRSYALDKLDMVKSNVGSALTVPQDDNWAWADFPVAYDPTFIANSEGAWLDFSVIGTIESNLKMDGIGTGIGGTPENVREFMAGSPTGPATVSKEVKKDLGQTFTAAKDKISGSMGNYNALKELLEDMYKKIPNMNSSNPIGYVSNNFKLLIGDLKESWVAQALPLIGAGVGIFDLFFGGGNSNTATVTPTFFGFNLSFSGQITTDFLLPNPKRIQVPKSKLNPEIPVFGSSVPILYNEHVGILNLLQTPVLQYKLYPQSRSGTYRTYWDFRVKDNLQIAVNPASGLVLDSIVSWVVMDPSPNVDLPHAQTDLDLELLATWVLDPTRKFNFESSIDGSFTFSSQHAPAGALMNQTIQGPDGKFIRPGIIQNGFSPDMTVKVKAVLHRADNSSAVPVVVIATYEPDFEDHGEGNWPSSPNVLGVNVLSPSYAETGGGGTYNVNGTNFGDTWVGAYVEGVSNPVVIEAVPPSSEWVLADWGDNSNNYDNPRTLIPQTNKTLRATFKMHLQSSSNSATAYPGQRKLLTWNGHHMVYASGGDVWYTWSTDGATWAPEKLVSRGTRTASNPSIADIGFYWLQDTTYIVWVDTTVYSGQVKHTVYFRNLATNTKQLQPITRIQADPYPTIYWARADAAPVAVRQGGMPNYPDVTIAYEGEGTGVLVTHRYYYGGNGIVWWTQPLSSSTASSSPSMCLSYDESPFNASLTFVDGADVYMSTCGGVYQVPSPFSEPEEVSTEELLDLNRNPVISADPTNNTKYVTWIGYDLDYQTDFTLVKNKGPEGNWRPLHAFVDDLGNPANLTSTICADVWGLGTTLFWSDREVLVNMVSPDGESWTVKDYSTYGDLFYYPNLPNVAGLSGIPSVLVKDSQAPYEVNVEMRDNTGEQLQKIDEDSVQTNVRHHRRISFVDSTGGRLTTQFGALKLLSQDGSFLRNLGFRNSVDIGSDVFLQSESFGLTARTLVGLDVGFRTQSWTCAATISVELIDSASGDALAVLTSSRIGTVLDTTFQGRFERAISQLNGGRPMHVALRLTGNGLEQFHSSIVNVMTLGSRGDLFKPQTESGEATPTLPLEFVLHQNYPNPFNPTTEIKFDMPDAGNVSLVVYDVLGRQVAELAGGYHSAGYHTARWNASNQSSGVYFARFIVTNAEGKPAFTKVNKLVLMK